MTAWVRKLYQHKLTVAFLLAKAGRHDEAVAVMEQHLKATNDLITAPARTKLLKMVSGT